MPEKCKPTVDTNVSISLSLCIPIDQPIRWSGGGWGGRSIEICFSILAFEKKFNFSDFFHTTGKRLRYSRVSLLLFTFAFGEFKEL